MGTNADIIIVPFPNSSHVYPATELARRLAARNCSVTLLLPSSASSSPSLHPLIQVVVEHPMPHPPPPPPPSFSSAPPGPPPQPDCSQFRKLLAEKLDGFCQSRSNPPVFAVVDVMMSQLLDVCKEFGVPALSFFSASACSTAMDHAVSKISTGEIGTGRSVVVPGLPDEMALTAADLEPCGLPSLPSVTEGPVPEEGEERVPSPIKPPPPEGGPPPPAAGGPPPPLGISGGPPRPGPQSLATADGAAALLFNTCEDLERSFLDYIAKQANKPVWGVGPLLPAQIWSAAASVVRDDALRYKGNAGPADITEETVLRFLDSKTRGSVIYVSFGSLVVPSDAELAALASALEASTRPFIWALQLRAKRHEAGGRPTEGGSRENFYPVGLAERAEGRGLVIRGWAPQLLILSHPATGGFVTHCGWNSTTEALALGVPMLAWPVRGDQIWNAKVVTRLLRTGLAVKEGSGAVTSAEVAREMELLMEDKGLRDRAAEVAQDLLAGGFPASSESAVDALLEFVAGKA